MDEVWERKVRERALLIWQRLGSPDGPPEQFRAMAEEELLDEGERPGTGERGEAASERPIEE
ncbi:MAG TPA: DUF2934 domain-containing protein [Geminicoccaceae bacterium]|nr:DUF2934 domain-containing protein [Geminicoccaceae bacterium]